MYDIESGNRRLYADALLTVSRALGVGVEWLLGELPKKTFTHLNENWSQEFEAFLTATAYNQSSVPHAGSLFRNSLEQHQPNCAY